jgi:coenzyme F420-reducing hydrogenase alpha subunit
MKKTVSICTRVEGHGAINFFIDKNEISSVNFELHAIRGFENILKKKKILDVPRIASRICGLCYAAQTIASCKAIEDILEIELSEQSIDLRRLLMIGELINSHSMHFFFQALPDLFVILKGEPRPASLGELLKFDRQLTTNMFELIKLGKETVNIFGGRDAHPITPVVGGMSHAPSKKALINVRRNFHKAINNLKWVIEKYHEMFSEEDPPVDYSLGDSAFLALNNHGNYDRYAGLLKIKQNDKTLAEFTAREYPKYIDRDRKMPGIHTYFDGEQKLYVGPLARNNLIENYGDKEIQPLLYYYGKKWQTNLLFSNYLRLIEMLAESYEALRLLDESKLTKPTDLTIPTTIQNSEGMGVVEAPRGTLLHHYKVDEKGYLDEVKLWVATEINIPTINDVLKHQSKKYYQEVKDLEAVKTHAQMILRTFDPCIACATH